MRVSLIFRVVPFVLALALVAAACGSDDSGDTTTTTISTTTSSSTTSSTTSTTSSTTTSSTTTSSTTTTLPGDPFDIVPAAGTALAVVGVEHDDVLNVRSGPGTEFDIIETLDPTSTEAISLGEGRLLPSSIWWKVDANGISGWANASFLAMIGVTEDATSAIVDSFGSIPTGETMLELGELVAGEAASEDPPSSIVVSVSPSVGDLGEITMDVIGLGDDSVRGVRLHIFGQESEDGAGFTLKSVESTALCGRGVTDEGLCV